MVRYSEAPRCSLVEHGYVDGSGEDWRHLPRPVVQECLGNAEAGLRVVDVGGDATCGARVSAEGSLVATALGGAFGTKRCFEGQRQRKPISTTLLPFPTAGNASIFVPTVRPSGLL